MDDAARRVAPGDLRAMVRHRQERESTALAEMQAAIRGLAEAMAAIGRAEADLAAREGARQEGEEAIYGRLGESGTPLTLPQLQDQLGALSRLTEEVEAARAGLGRVQREAESAAEHLAEMRERYALRAREAAKWVRIEDEAAASRRRASDMAEEIEREDEVSLRHGRLVAELAR